MGIVAELVILLVYQIFIEFLLLLNLFLLLLNFYHIVTL